MIVSYYSTWNKSLTLTEIFFLQVCDFGILKIIQPLRAGCELEDCCCKYFQCFDFLIFWIIRLFAWYDMVSMCVKHCCIISQSVIQFYVFQQDMKVYLFDILKFMITLILSYYGSINLVAGKNGCVYDYSTDPIFWHHT